MQKVAFYIVVLFSLCIHQLHINFPSRFKDVTDRFGEVNAKLSWNPCNKWTQQSPAGTSHNNCQDVAVSQWKSLR